MMESPREFHYRLPGRVGGQRPGSHPGSSMGAGQEFVAHRSLYDYPDPRRLDLRASVRTLQEGWLVRVNRQRAGTAVRALVDVSASMSFGATRPKLHVVADFVEALGLSAFRVGDALGMMAFDSAERAELFMPARVSRGMGSLMGAALREWGTVRLADADVADAASAANAARAADAARAANAARVAAAARAANAARIADAARAAAAVHEIQPPSTQGSIAAASRARRGDGIQEAAARLAGQQGLVFLISDFHWPLESLNVALDLMAHATVIPIVVWDPAETEPPKPNALAALSDMESNGRRTLWLRPKLRDDWRHAVARRRAEIDHFCNARSLRPFYMVGRFDADSLSRYFFEVEV